MVFFAGYATAVYTLMPVPDHQANQGEKMHEKKTFNASSLQSSEFAQSLNTGIHKCFDIAKEAACRTAKLVKEKIEQRQVDSNRQ